MIWYLVVHLYISLAILSWRKRSLRSASDSQRVILEFIVLIIFLSLVASEALLRVVVTKCQRKKKRE